MDKNKPDIKPDMKKLHRNTLDDDRSESISLMEPLLISEGSKARNELTDLVLTLAQHTSGFRKSLPNGIMATLANLVRTMNCYYSNLIEGHNTHPIDIERALHNDHSSDPKQRNLQLEAKAHILVQKWIDEGNLDGRALTAEGIRELHRKFCMHLPDELLWQTIDNTNECVRLVPGEYRTHNIQVGRHIPVSPSAIPYFMARFEAVYTHLGKTDTILSAATAHHRLAWIHPFLDGNGRVMRLMSYAVLREQLETGGTWSIARGLARNVDDYKAHLANCDQPRRNDLDGRGHLSEEALAEFTRFFLNICIDQVKFMEALVQPERLRTRIKLWAEEEIRLGNLPPKVDNVLEAVLYRGELPRRDIPDIVGTGARQASRIVSSLIEKDVVIAETTRAPLNLNFPATLAGRWLPGLFPDNSE